MNKDFSQDLKAESLLLFTLFIGSTFCCIMCLENQEFLPGCLLGGLAVVFLGLTVWSTKHPFAAAVTGLACYFLLLFTLVYFFPKIIGEGLGFLSPYIYLLMFLLAFLYLIKTGASKKTVAPAKTLQQEKGMLVKEQQL